MNDLEDKKVHEDYLRSYVDKCFRVNNDGRIFSKGEIIKIVGYDRKQFHNIYEDRFVCNVINREDCPHQYYLEVNEFVGWIGTDITLVDEQGNELVKDDEEEEQCFDVDEDVRNKCEKQALRVLYDFYVKNNDIPFFPNAVKKFSFDEWIDYINLMGCKKL